MPSSDITETDRQIMRLRALGYSQVEIAGRLGVTQSAVSQRIRKIRRAADASPEDADATFWKLLIGLGAVYLLSKLMDNRGR
jgi:DNA-directed RNA polymerase specialized sigma24 family protein